MEEFREEYEAKLKLMRHRSDTTTQRYINMAQGLNQAINKLHVPAVLKPASAS